MKFFNAGNITILIGLLMISYAFYTYYSHWYLRPKYTPNNIKLIPTNEDKLIFSDNKINPQINAKIGIKKATYDKNTGPEVFVIWYLNWKASAVGNKPKYNIGIIDWKLKYEGWLNSL